jgi:[NiFe] hydrogenase assembly HybE family chaperone
MVSGQVTPIGTEDPPVAAAPNVRIDNPESKLEHFFAGQSERPPVNATLSCRALGFARYRGDWLGVVITPWFVDLYLLPGGGELWGDIPSGQRRYVELPRGTVPFTAADNPQIGPYQYSPLISPVSVLPDMTAAIKLANDVLSGIFGEPARTLPVSPAPQGVSDQGGSPGLASRRGFLRRLAGKR